ncbi:two-component system nitrate/nitrite response regulator NarL [Microvirga lupini]|uniref:Two-component system nitrate/nitrite response regulator NarL n=1 Tax=Microvirga lupini TaxID=420324 RepID=A0A7W4YYB8_9HYPH|nr:response regulator transcription factor [Microvirga lupini]MBB3021350.1 two-component system nitrate/nitrite response regulator NarL [Microvirga lupini]
MTTQTLTLVHDCSSDPDLLSGSSIPTISTALICDSALFRSALQHSLRDTPFAIAEAASVTGPKRLQYCAVNTALVIIEASQNTRRVLEVVRQVRERSPETRIVALADQFDLSFVRTAHEAGVSGFCLTAGGPEVLIKSLELVMLGESVLPFEVLRSLIDAAPRKHSQPLQDSTTEPKLSDLKDCKLSMREAEILGCLTKGEPNKVIARRLDITEATIKVHVKAILRKIGASNRTQAAMWASQRLPQHGRAPMSA